MCLLERLDAVSFSFLADNLPPGVHTNSAQVNLFAFGVGGGNADGSVGHGTMTIETVHIVTDQSDIPTLN